MSDALHRILELTFLDRGGALEPTEAAELRSLLGSLDEDTRARLDREVGGQFASLERAFGATEIGPAEDLPADVRKRLDMAMRSSFGDRADQGGPMTIDRGRNDGMRWGAWLGWAIAAGLAVVAAMQFLRPPSVTPPAPTIQQLVDAAPDTVRVALASNDPSAANANGHVLWSSSLQKGYAVLNGLAPNDAGAAQYQLWVIDPSRDEKPVDAGVFNVAAGTTTVPFAPKLAIASPSAFAITSEKPGGVVVTDGPILLLGANQ